MPMEILNKMVKVSDPHLLQYFFPTFKIRESVSILDSDKDIIYVGPVKNNLRKYLMDHTKNFISTVGNYEVDLTDPVNLVTFVCEYGGRKPSKKILEFAEDMKDSKDTSGFGLIESMCKEYWIRHRWSWGEEESGDGSVFALFKASVETEKYVVEEYFELRKSMPFEVIRACFVTFLQKVYGCYKANDMDKWFEENSVKSAYADVIRKAAKTWGKYIRNNILWKMETEEDFINMLIGLREMK